MEETLDMYLSRKSAECEKLENRFLYLSELLYFLAIFSSTVAAVSGALSSEKSIPALCLAVAGALPGLLIAFDNRFRLRARSDWNANFKVGYQALWRQLKLEGKSPAEVSPQVSKFEKDMEEQYPVRASNLPTLGK